MTGNPMFVSSNTSGLDALRKWSKVKELAKQGFGVVHHV